MRGHIRPRSKSSFELKYDIGKDNNGKRQTITKSFKGTRKEAQAELARLLARVVDGGHVAPNRLTVAGYLDERITTWRTKRTISAKTEAGYRGWLRNQIAPFIGTRLLQKFTARDVENWHTALLTKGRRGRNGRPDGQGGISARTVKHAHQLLDQAMDEAVKHGLVLRNVFAIQRPPKVEAKEMRILNGEQIAGFPALVDGDELAAPAITSLFAGTRRGEDLALRWGRLELDAKVLMVRESLEKTKKEGVQFRPPKTKASKRDISLPDIVVETLRAHRKRTLERRLLLGLGKLSDDDLVFPDWTGPSPGTLPQDPNAFSAAWSRLAAKLGLKVSFHELRHTHASQLIDEGVDIVKIAKRLGHGSPAITLSTYAHLFERKRKKEEQDPAADAINKALSRKE